MKKIIVVFGTRPEAIKLCSLVLELKKNHEFKTLVLVTAQHREMLDQVLSIFNVVPDYDLNIMGVNQTLFDITSRVLVETGKILEKERPDFVIVQGDTTTTFATALAAFYLQIKVLHVEAGLRTYNKYSPFPEELNRKMTGVIADFHFAATERNKSNLLKEGVPETNISVTGNTVIDSLLWVKEKMLKNQSGYTQLDALDLDRKIILITGHRRENFGIEFENICNAIKKIALTYKDIDVVYPVHFNPNVRKPVNAILAGIPNVKIIEPLEYEPFVFLMIKSFLIITDSGGIQEEAPSLGKPVLVIRNTTERQEAVEAGCVKLVGTNLENIFNEAKKLIENEEEYIAMARIENPYGDGKACEKISHRIKDL